MSEKLVDYLVLGSGLSALSFSALMAQRGRSVKILEAHEHFGGYGHTFSVGKDYQFNAQLHYVISCGEGETVHTFLKHLGLEKKVTFELLNAEGYDRCFCDGVQLNIPYGLENLRENMLAIDPSAKEAIDKFINLLIDFRSAAEHFPRHQRHAYTLLKAAPSVVRLFSYRNATLQEVFDACGLPMLLQTLVAGQLIDYMLPPKDLSFLIWCALFNGYCKGAYYPTHHFSHVVDNVCDSIRKNGGELIANQQVVEFILEDGKVCGVYAQAVDPQTGLAHGPRQEYRAREVICNFDPRQAAEMIGWDKFSKNLKKRLCYDYSYSSFVLYGVVRDLDLSQHGFGDWNIWHCQLDHNKSFDAMYNNGDYSKPYFATNCRSLHTKDSSHCTADNCQTLQICTWANYKYWQQLKMRSRKEYNLKKKEVLEHLLTCIEDNYVPNLREHMALQMTGSPTTNERYVNAPEGGSYGVNLTPRNFSYWRKLSADSSIDGLWFCSAASGVAGFSGTILTGMQLYERLSGDFLD